MSAFAIGSRLTPCEPTSLAPAAFQPVQTQTVQLVAYPPRCIVFLPPSTTTANSEIQRLSIEVDRLKAILVSYKKKNAHLIALNQDLAIKNEQGEGLISRLSNAIQTLEAEKREGEKREVTAAKDLQTLSYVCRVMHLQI